MKKLSILVSALLITGLTIAQTDTLNNADDNYMTDKYHENSDYQTQSSISDTAKLYSAESSADVDELVNDLRSQLTLQEDQVTEIREILTSLKYSQNTENTVYGLEEEAEEMIGAPVGDDFERAVNDIEAVLDDNQQEEFENIKDSWAETLRSKFDKMEATEETSPMESEVETETEMESEVEETESESESVVPKMENETETPSEDEIKSETETEIMPVPEAEVPKTDTVEPMNDENNSELIGSPEETETEMESEVEETESPVIKTEESIDSEERVDTEETIDAEERIEPEETIEPEVEVNETVEPEIEIKTKNEEDRETEIFEEDTEDYNYEEESEEMPSTETDTTDSYSY